MTAGWGGNARSNVDVGQRSACDGRTRPRGRLEPGRQRSRHRPAHGWVRTSRFGWESSLSDLRIHQSHSILANRRSHRIRRSSGVCRRCGRCGDGRPGRSPDGVGREGGSRYTASRGPEMDPRSGSAARRARRFRATVSTASPSTGRLRAVLVGPTRYKVLDRIGWSCPHWP